MAIKIEQERNKDNSNSKRQIELRTQKEDKLLHYKIVHEVEG